VKEHIPDEILKLKQLAGKDIGVFGSSDLATTLKRTNLIDEYRFMVNPVILGKGKTIFGGKQERLNLKLHKTQTFRSGNVLLFYEPGKA
jgi:dihydrofolate reductase